jgi:glutathione S-transferase
MFGMTFDFKPHNSPPAEVALMGELVWIFVLGGGGALISYISYLVINRHTTSVTGWRVAISMIILSSYLVISTDSKFSLMKTLCSLPLVALFSYLIIRVILGVFPVTFHGARFTDLTKFPKRYRLVAMPINHFGEKVRWCMDLIGIPYEEMDVGGIMSITLRNRTVPWLVDFQSNSIIGNSDEILMYLSAVYVPTLSGSQKSLAQQLLARNEVTMAWEEELNRFGHAIQGWAYHYVLGNANIPAKYTLRAWGAYDPKISFLERWLLQISHPVIRFAMTYLLRLHDSTVHQSRQHIIDSLLDKVDSYFDKNPSSLYLTGDQLSYVDIIFCSLTAPLLFFTLVSPPPTSQKSYYAKNRFSSFVISNSTEYNELLSKYPKALLEFEKSLLSRPCGKYVVRMYLENRWKVFE